MSSQPERTHGESPTQAQDQQKVSLITKAVTSATIMGVPAVIGGIVGFGISITCGFEEGRKTFGHVFDKPKQREFKPEQLNAQLASVQEAVDIQVGKYFFQKKAENLNAAFWEISLRKNPNESINLLHQIAIEHLFEGFRLLNRISSQPIATYVEDSPGLQINFDGKAYDLNNPFQFQIVFALTSLKLDEKVQSEDLENEIEIHPKSASANNSERVQNLQTEIHLNHLDQKAIIWLNEQYPSTGFTPDSILFINPQSLARFARTLRLLNQLGYPYPRIGLLGPNAQFGGMFVEKGYYASNHTVVDYADRFGSVDSLVHEFGHYVAKISTDVNPEFSQGNFNQLMDRIETTNLPLVTNENEVHFYIPAKYRKDRKEQYAYFFESFVNDGEGLRKNIAYKRNEDPAAANILNAEYDFFKSFFQGKEFVRDGLTQEELTIKRQPEKSYSIGQRIIIADTDQERPGIFLRPSPAGAITPDTPTVFDGDDVEIVEGPFVIKRQTWDDQGKPIIIDKNWWRVRIYFQEALGRTKVGRQTGAEGWISEEWFGKVMK